MDIESKLNPTFSWEGKMSVLFMKFVKMTLRYILTRQLFYHLNRNIPVELLRCTTLVLATTLVVVLSNLLLTNSASAYFLNMNWIGHSNPKEVILKGNPSQYARHSIQVRTPYFIDYQVLWYESNASGPLVLAGQTMLGTRPTDFKYGRISVEGQINILCFGGAQYTCFKLHFEPNATEFNKIPVGKTIKIEIRVKRIASHGTEENRLTLNITRDNNGIKWSTDSTGTQIGQTTTTDFDNQNGILTTYTSDLANLSFKSQLYDNSETPVETTLTKSEVESNWAGEEWTTLTPYGRWIIGNETPCTSTPGNNPGAKCFNVKFEPNDTALNTVTERNLKINLIVNESVNAEIIETDSLTYTFESYRSVTLSNGIDENSGIIILGSETSFADISGNTAIFKAKAETISIEAKEISNSHTQSPTTTTGSNSSTTNTDAGFTSKTYGTNLTYGKWYLEENDQTANDDTVNSEFHTINRRILFRPNVAAILAVQNNAEHTANLVITIKNGDSVIATNTISILISRPTIPILSISAVNSSVNEGVAAEFKVTSSVSPGTQAMSVSYTTNDPGSYLDTSSYTDGKPPPLSLRFQDVSGVPTATFSIALRTKDNKDTENGNVTVTLAPDSAPTTTYIVNVSPHNSAKVTVKDLDVPVISIEENAPATFSTLEAQFILTADIQPWQPLAIRYLPRNISPGKYIASTTNGSTQIASPKITFAPSDDDTKIIGTLPIPTIEDSSNTSGTISVQILDDNQTDQSYQINGTEAENTKTAQISDIIIPMLSIETSTLSINEGDTASIEITANKNPQRNITFHYTPTVTGSNFLRTFNGKGTGDSRTATLEFTQNQTTNKWTATLMLRTRDDDEIDTPHSIITVTLDTPGPTDKYTIATSPNDRISITVVDATLPLITMIGNAPDVTSDVEFEDGVKYALFPLRASFQPHAPVLVKYTAINASSNFLVPTQNNIRTSEVLFSGSSPNFTGDLKVPTKDDPDAASGTISVTLQGDSNNYTLSNLTNQLTASATIHDLSYVEVNSFRDYQVVIHPIPGSVFTTKSQVATLYIGNQTSNYHVDNITHVLSHETNLITVQAKWFVGDSTIPEGTTSPQTGGNGQFSVATPFGSWKLFGDWGGRNPHSQRRSAFQITSDDIRNLPIGDTAKIEIHLSVPHGISSIATLHIVPFSATTWNSNSKQTLSELPNTSAARQTKEATFETRARNLDNYTFKSKLFDQSTIPTEQTLIQEEQVAGWSGQEYTVETTYGRWIVGNQSTCQSVKKCMDVRFVPNISAVNGISGRVVKIALEISHSGNPEGNILSYIIDGTNVNFILDQNNSNTIIVTSDSDVLNDVTGSVQIYVKPSDYVNIQVSETTTDLDSPTTTGTVSTTTTMDAGFEAKEYGTNFTFGSWYYAETNNSPTVNDFVDSNFRKLSRQIIFRPNLTTIADLQMNSTRKSTMTISISRGGQTIKSNSLAITMNKIEIPEFTITAVNSIVNEGGIAQFKVSTNQDPGTEAIQVNFTPTESNSNYLDSTTGTSGESRTVDLTFTKTQDAMEWTDTFDLAMRAIDNIDTVNGTISVILNNTIGTIDDIKYRPSLTPAEVTVIDQNTPVISIANAPQTHGGLDINFTLTADIQPAEDITVRFIPTNTNFNFLDITGDSRNGGLSGSIRTQTLTFSSSGSGQPIIASLLIATVNDESARSANPGGIITVELLDDNNNTPKTYTISADSQNNIATANIVSNQYVSISFHPTNNYPNIITGSETTSLFIKDTSATHPHILAKFRIQLSERPHFTKQIKIFHDDVLVEESSVILANNNRVTSSYGTWVISNFFTCCFNTGHGIRDVHFEPNNTKINSIPLGTKVRVELHLALTRHQVNNITTLHIEHNTTTTWNSNSEATVSVRPNTANASETKEATIVTHHDNLTGLSFKSKLYDQSSTPTEVTLTQMELVSSWPGSEWTALVTKNQITYGRWIVGNQTTCHFDAKCYDVRFEPNTTSINKIANRIVKADLEISTTTSGQSPPEEVDSLSYIMSGNNLTLSLDANNSSVIKAPDSATTFADISGTATAFKKAVDGFNIEVMETTTNQAQPTTTGAVSSATNTDAGFESKEYGTNLTLGTWYFEESDSSSTPDQIDANFHIETRQFKFKPNTTNIRNLVAGSVRYSTITISTTSGSNTIDTKTLAIAIYRTDLPNFSISVVNSTINEGDSAQFKITADKNPGSSPVTINITPTNTAGNYLEESNDSNGNSRMSGDSRSVPITFSQTPGQNEWTSTFDIAMRNIDNIDADHGWVTVILDPITGPVTSSTYTTSPDNSAKVQIIDQDVPKISINPVANIVANQYAEFTLTADIEPWQPLAVRYIPTEASSNYLDTTNGASGAERIAYPKISFARAGAGPMATGTLSIPTVADSNVTSGSISIQLTNDPSASPKNYELTDTVADRMANVQIATAPTPVLSIMNSSTAVNEGETATIVVTASEDPKVPVTINYTPTETEGNFLNTFSGASGKSRTTTLNFSDDGSGNWTANFTLTTRTANGVDENQGEIIVALDLPIANANYTIADLPNNQITIFVNDVDAPIISIDNASATIMGKSVLFPVSASILPRYAVELRYTAVSTGGNFLVPIASEANSIRTATVTFYSQGPNFPKIGTLVVPTKVDPDANAGSITITLANDNSNPVNYYVSESANEQEGVASILDDPGPTLRISSVTSNIIEGGIAKFIVTANPQPKSAINVKFTPTNVSGSYLDSTINPTGVEKIRPLSFYQRFGSDDWTAELIVYTRNVDRTVQAGGVIGVVLNPADDISNYVVASEPNHFSTVMVQDSDIPIISIGNAPDTIIGHTAKFTLVADIQPDQALEITYIVTEEKGNFLNEANYSADQEQSGQFSFTPVAGQGIIATLLVDTVPDPNLKEGTISVTIFNDLINSPKRYKLPSNATNNSAHVNLISTPIPTLSFDSTQPIAKEGTDSYVTVIANKDPKRELTINYTLFDSTNNSFLDPIIPDPNTTVLNQDGSITKTETVTFSQRPGSTTWTANLPVPIRAKDDRNTSSGEIRVVLDNPVSDAGYEIITSVAKSTAITVNDTNVPVISIHRVNSAIAGFGMEVILSSDIETSEPIAINYKPMAQKNNSWLDETDGISGETRTTTPLTFVSNSAGRPLASFTISTRRGPQNNPQGLITVELQPDTNNLIKYEPTFLYVDQNGNNVYQSVSAVIYPGSTPEFSLNAGVTTMNQNQIEFSEMTETNNQPFQEGDTIKLQIAASSVDFPDIALIPSLNLTYTVENLTGNYITLTEGATTETRTVKLAVRILRAGTYGNYIDLPLRSRDNLDSKQGKIKITLNTGTNYGVTSNNEVTILINNHQQDTPVISISDAPEILPTDTAQFTLVSNIQPWGPVSIKYVATNSLESNFLGTTTPTQSVTFTQPTSDHRITGKLLIPTIEDDTNTAGIITITILENNSTPNDNSISHDYTLSTNTNEITATVQVKTSTSIKPTLYIRPSEDTANEGGTAKFVVTASNNPGASPLNVKWSKVEAVGNFLDTTISGQTQETNIDPWNFTQSSPSEPWTYELTLQLKTPANSTDEAHGRITVTLETPVPNATYLVAESPLDSATKTIFDQTIPVISITNASETLAGNLAQFTLTTITQPHAPLNIKYIAENLMTGGKFLDTIDGESGTTRISENLTFTPTQNPNEYVATLFIQTTDDIESTTGRIKIVLVDDDDPKNYTIMNSNDKKEAEVQVIDKPIPELSLINANPSATSEDSPAVIVIATDEDPKQPLSIRYTPTSIKGNYLNTANGQSSRTRTTAPLTFALDNVSGKYIAMFSVAINSDSVDADHGEIFIVLDEPIESSDYTVAPAPNNEIKIIVYDDETPLITVENQLQSVVAGNIVEFTLTSDLKPWQDIAIRFIPENGPSTNFLDTSSGMGDSRTIRTTTPLEFKPSGSEFTAKLKVPTVDDPTATSGKISITLRPDIRTSQKTQADYRISVKNSEKTADATIIDPTSIPTVSISNIDTTINEGEIAVFTITATADPQRPLDIKYTPVNNSNGNFLDTTGGVSGSIRTKRVKFTESIPSVWTAMLEVPTKAPNGIDDEDGSITVTLNDATISNGYLRHSSEKSGMVSVKDADAPIITVENATETLAGNDAKFKLTANIRPQGDELTIYFTPTNVTGDFLNSTAQMQSVQFSSSGIDEPYTGDLLISTQDDASLTAGSISIVLQNDTTNTPKKYKISPISALNSAIGHVIDVPNPILSISTKYDNMVEGDMLSFIVTASKNPKQKLMVKYTPTEDTPVGDRHFDSTHATYPHTTQISTTQELTFRQLHTHAPWSSEIHIPVRNADGKDADNSNISVTLDHPNSGAGYRIKTAPKNSVRSKILDAETPVITIMNASQTLAGNMAKFTLTSDINPWQDLDIKFIPSETIGNFLDTSNFNAEGVWVASNVDFTRSNSTQPWTATLMVPTADDPNNETGEISITLVDDAGSEDYEKNYTINTDAVPSSSPTEYFHKAKVEVVDVSIPILSIDEIPNPVTEGSDITLVIRADKNPIRQLKIWYIPENISQSFLDTTDGISGVTRVTDRLTFSREQGDNDWSTKIIVTTNDDDLDNPHGSIKITLVVPDVSDSEFAGAYTISSTPGDDNSTITIRDNEVPQISIASANQNEIIGGLADATFTLTSHIEPHTKIVISFTPTNGPDSSPGNFLDQTDPVSNTTKMSGETRMSKSLEFTDTNSDSVFSATLTIPTLDDRTNQSGEIKVQLVDDTGDDKDYTLSTTRTTSAKISVIQVPHPRLTIAYNGSTINEGDSATFKVIADQDPKRPLTINYTPTNNTGYDFLKVDTTSEPPLATSGTMRTASEKMFGEEQINGVTMWTTEITVPTQSKRKDEPHGSITVTLNNSPTNNPYIIDSTSDDNNAEVSVNDLDVPKISIASATPGESIIGIMDATFTLTSHIKPHDAIVISFTPINGPNSSPSNFLDPTDPVSNTTKESGETRMSESLTFTSPPELDPPIYTASLTVPTQDDRINSTGEIKVELVDDTGDKDYTLSTTLSTSATVSIVQTPYPLLTVTSKVAAINEGESATFTIMANKNPKRDLIVNYTPENNIGGDFLKVDTQKLKPSGEIRTIKITKAMFVPKPTLNPTMWTAEITIPTRPSNGKDEDHGSLKVTLNDAPVENPYMIDKSSDKNYASVTVHDIDVPKISIASINQNEILGGLDDATFTLTSDIEPRAEIVVSYTPTNGPNSFPGNFLDLTDPVSNTTKMSGETRMSESLEFTDTNSDSVFTATLTIPTVDDRSNESGEIKVQLVDDTGDDKAYTLSTTRPTADKVTIIQVPHPLLTIFYNGTAITEGETATFTINASKEPKRDLSINYTPENNTEGNYLKVDLEDLKSSGVMRTVTIANNMFTPEPTLNPTLWTAEITIPTRAVNGIDENHGSITVTLNNSPTNNPYIIDNSSDDNLAEVDVHDFDAPEIAISNAVETFAGNEIMFTLTASIEPLNDLEIQFIPTEAISPATNSVTNFLNPNDPVSEMIKESSVLRTSARLEFTRTGEDQPYTAILKLPTQVDQNAESGTISVELQQDSVNVPPTYTLTSNPNMIAQNTATASVVKKVNPVLSITYNGNAIREGQTASFMIVSDEDPKRDLKINFTPENNANGNFLKVDSQDLKPSGEKRFVTISKGMFTLVQGQNPPIWSTELTIETREPNGIDENHGSITVTLEEPDSAVSEDYTISNGQGKNNATVPVYDLEEPKISILPAVGTFGGEDAEFALEAHIQPWKPLTVRFIPSNDFC